MADVHLRHMRTKQELPFRWGYDRMATAVRVEGTGKSWQPL